MTHTVAFTVVMEVEGGRDCWHAEEMAERELKRLLSLHENVIGDDMSFTFTRVALNAEAIVSSLRTCSEWPGTSRKSVHGVVEP